MENLIITERTEDFHICFESDKRIWECGKTIEEAVFNFVLTHKEKLNIGKILESTRKRK